MGIEIKIELTKEEKKALIIMNKNWTFTGWVENALEELSKRYLDLSKELPVDQHNEVALLCKLVSERLDGTDKEPQEILNLTLADFLDYDGNDYDIEYLIEQECVNYLRELNDILDEYDERKNFQY